jgi:hypothetical protein
MCVAQHAERSDAWSEAVLASVARTLLPEERADLEEALATSAARWEARANPMLEQLDDADPDETLEAWLKRAPPNAMIAYATSRSRVCAPDGFCVTARAVDAACPAGWSVPSSSEEDARARFVLWPWGQALRLRLASPGEANEVAERIRAHVRDSTRVGLVLAPDDDAVTRAEPYVHLRDLWRRHGRFRAIAHRKPPEVGAMTALQPAELVIVPRRPEAIHEGDSARELLDPK